MIDIGGSVWRHYAGVYDQAAGTRQLYIDGVLDSGVNVTGETSGWAQPRFEWLVSGGRDNGGSINAFSRVMLDDIRIYDESLDTAAIRQLAGLVPEPGTFGLILLGMGGLVGLRRRR